MFDYTDSIKSEKSKLKVVIFGPYGEGGFERLELLKNYLHSHGYTQSDVVENLPDPPNSASLSKRDFEIAKSKYWVTLADVSLYVVFKNIKRGLLTVEMEELAGPSSYRVPCASFFIESGEPLESFEWDLLDRMKKDHARFDTDNDLFLFAKMACLHHLVEDDCIQNI